MERDGEQTEGESYKEKKGIKDSNCEMETDTKTMVMESHTASWLLQLSEFKEKCNLTFQTSYQKTLYTACSYL